MVPTSPKTNNQDYDAVKNWDEIVAESGFENIQMAPMSPNTNHESQDQEQEENNHVKACNQEKLTRKISEPLIESDTSSSNADNCSTSMCLETVQKPPENAESEGKNIFAKYLSFSVKRIFFDHRKSKPFL